MKALIFIAIVIILSGCSEQPVNPLTQAPASTPAKEVKQKTSETALMAGAGMSEDGRSGYNYKPAGRRDPFRSLIL